jgi:AraC family transcriptional regulator
MFRRHAVRQRACIRPNPNRREYQKCVQRMINYIGTHVGEELDLPMLAAIAGFSPYHFHRIFKSVTGETLFDCVRRMRLEWAATLLQTHRHLSISEVAVESGFGAQAPFARAFRNHFGMSASEWRRGDFWRHTGDRWDWRNAAPADVDSPGTLRDGLSVAHSHDLLAKAASGERPSCLRSALVTGVPGFRVLYMRHIGPYDPERQAVLWKRFICWATTRGLATPDSVWISVIQDNQHVVAPERCRYDVGLVVAPEVLPCEEVDVQDLPGGDYLVADFAGNYFDELLAGEYLWKYWLPTNSLQQDVTRSFFTRLQGDPDRRPPSRSETYCYRFFIPVVPSGRPVIRPMK